jgi:hypothetical protein
MDGVTFPMSSEVMSGNIDVSVCKAEVERKVGNLTIVTHRKMLVRGVDADFLAKGVSTSRSSTFVASVLCQDR